MAMILLTKNELKKQRDALKLYSRYLPTLLLKKQQLQLMLRRISENLENKRNDLEKKLHTIHEWIAVLGEQIHFEEYIKIKRLVIKKSSIAGVEVPLFDSIDFELVTYDLFTTPLWVDTAVLKIKELITLQMESQILQNQYSLLHNELVVTTQRVNLFEKINIPKAREIIRKINISLADQQTASVVRGKISKRKMEAHERETRDAV